MTAYYNEFDPYAAEWLKNLINAGLLPAGDIDTRSITEVKADDIKNYTQCHFFAGIGGWPLALRMAGWEDDRSVWTGSCPCQPFSTAGKQKGKKDERHLWPAWFKLIQEFRPSVVFGEQVAAAIAHGWLDDVFDDLEGEGYACGAAVLPACSVGAPHKRDRLWFVGNAKHDGQIRPSLNRGNDAAVRDYQKGAYGTCEPSGTGGVIDVADSHYQRSQRWQLLSKCSSEQSFGEGGLEWVKCPDGKHRPVKPGIRLLADGVSGRVGKLRALGNAFVPEVAKEFIIAAEGLIS